MRCAAQNGNTLPTWGKNPGGPARVRGGKKKEEGRHDPTSVRCRLRACFVRCPGARAVATDL
ncbi:protein of unknown function [Rhodovastum atsumiense]|nr:protein of unknown function [Rhodovastum atsumiense]